MNLRDFTAGNNVSVYLCMLLVAPLLMSASEIYISFLLPNCFDLGSELV